MGGKVKKVSLLSLVLTATLLSVNFANAAIADDSSLPCSDTKSGALVSKVAVPGGFDYIFDVQGDTTVNMTNGTNLLASPNGFLNNYSFTQSWLRCN